jgi:site-specific DNA-cytosine methylase
MKQCALKIFEMWWTKSRRAQNVDDYETWISGGVVPTLNVFDNASETRATVLIIDGTRVNDVRVYEDGIVPTVISRYGTGGGNVPMVFSHTQGLDVQASEENSPTLRAGGAGMAVAFSPSGFADYSEGIGTLRAGMTNNNSPILAFDEFNNSIDEVQQTMRAKKDSTGVIDEQTVRRLTPVECERLQGFPDDWTSGQADSSRYKQMGNAVAVPVVEWIVSRMVAELVDE